MKKIVVTGDLVMDYNILHMPSSPLYHHQAIRSTIEYKEKGGAWFLARLIKKVCKPVPVSEPHYDPHWEMDEKTSPLNKAYQIWSLYDKIADGKGKAWRIENFLGCERAHTPDSVSLPYPGADDADILVIDDLGLNFRNNEKLWPSLLTVGNPKKIFIKTSSIDVTTPLWKKLLQPQVAKKVTVIMSIATLRERGAAISKGFSWDRTLEELADEFSSGRAASELAKCSRVVVFFHGDAVASFTRNVLRFKSSTRFNKIRFERFLFDPMTTEGHWTEKRPGIVFGTGSLVTAALIRHEMNPADLPLYLALGRALAAARLNHESGAGQDKEPEKFDLNAACVNTIKILRYKYPKKSSAAAKSSDKKRIEEKKSNNDAAFAYVTAFPQYTDKFEYGLQISHGRASSDILKDVSGNRRDYIFAKALEVVTDGHEKALHNVPKACFRKYFSVDREEIERINAIYNLIRCYIQNKKDMQPLSLAVFGPPGSGKSFAIKELIVSITQRTDNIHNYNLAYVRDEAELIEIFHKIHDDSIKNQVPLVFWDEFDCDNLRWLKYFLAPMQDGEFRSGSSTHPFGKTIFVFAGGTCRSFDEFNITAPPGTAKNRNRKSAFQEQWDTFRRQKGPDFVSRLRCYLNIKDLNPVDPCLQPAPRSGHPAVAEDLTYLIRRAIRLRTSLKKHHPQLFDPFSDVCTIQANVLSAFLDVNRYLHGSRSIDSVISLCNLSGLQNLTIASLPPREFVLLHMSADFFELLQQGEIEMHIIEILAKACHEAWKEEKEKQGYQWGPERNDDPPDLTHPLIMDYHKLPEWAKERNRQSARLTKAKLHAVGYEISLLDQKPGLKTKLTTFPGSVRDKLLQMEHDIWLREHLIDGYEYNESSSKDDLRLHTDIAEFSHISGDNKKLNEVIIDSIIPALEKHGYGIFHQT